VSAAAPDLALSEDALLGGRIRLRQPVAGYRVAIDPLLLAAAVPAAAGDTVLDIGCGVGAAALALAARVTDCRITGLEAERPLVRLANENAALNHVADRFEAIAGDLLAPPSLLAPGSFAHVMANPPYLERGTATLPQDGGKAAANVEGNADLAAWIDFALAMLRPKGSVTIIHRADRLEHALAGLMDRAGEIIVYPLWAGTGKAAKRVIIRARRGVATPTRLASGLVLHENDGRFTAAADAVLRGGAALFL
jgi:tRNA1(Val) A37 N6-methylase TrmN6